MHFFDRRWVSAGCVRMLEVSRSTLFTVWEQELQNVYVPKTPPPQPSGLLVKGEIGSALEMYARCIDSFNER